MGLIETIVMAAHKRAAHKRNERKSDPPKIIAAENAV